MSGFFEFDLPGPIPDTDLPDTLHAAVKARALANGAIAGQLATDFAWEAAPPEPKPPYVVATMPSQSDELITDTSQVQAGALTLRSHGATAAQAAALADALMAEFRDRPVDYAGGFAFPLILKARTRGKEWQRGAGGKYLYTEAITFTCRLWMTK